MSILESYEGFMTFYKDALNHTDERTRPMFMVKNDPIPVATLIVVYLLIITVGKSIMKRRSEIYVPTFILFIYNFGLVLLSIYIIVEVIIGAIQLNYSPFCGEMTYTKAENRITNALWWYYFSKAIELMDTVWMVIRKRFNQITFLHCFHHVTMLMIWWVVIHWIPAGQSIYGSSLNCLVHVFMYSYYALSVIPSMKDKLWWKRYITLIQLIQFVITFSHTSYGIAISHGFIPNKSCNFPKWGQYMLAIYMVLMLILFTNFYVQEYIKKSNDIKRKKLDINKNKLNQKKSD